MEDDSVMVALDNDGEIILQLQQNGATLEIGMSQALAERLVAMLSEILNYAVEHGMYDDYPRTD